MAAGSLTDRFRLVETLVGEGPLRTYRATAADGRMVFIRAVQAGPDKVQTVLTAVPPLMSPETPAAARLVDAGPIAGGYFVARDWVEGETLDAYLRRPEVTPDVAARYVADALAQLAVLHRAGVVHGDVRPNSIIIGATGALSLVDAGLPAGAARRDEYTSPEELRGETPTAASDIYRMGLVLCKAITGKLPFAGGTPEEISTAHLDATPASPSALDGTAPAALDAVVATALAKLPAERYADADRMREAIDSALRPLVVVDEPAPRSKTWLWVTLAVVAALLLGGAIWYFFVRVPQVAAPKVVGMTQPAAEAAITGAGLRVGKVSDEPTLAVAPGTVITQTPAPAAMADKGSAVNLTVSSVPVVDVPKVVGDGQDEATTKLAQAGLRLGDVVYVYDPKAQAGFVTAQNPAAAATAAVGSAVTLTVSKGAQSGKVPNVVGLGQSDAESALVAAGFTTKATKSQSTSIPAGVVKSQAPAAGAGAAVGSAVNLTVSSGTSATPKPTVPNVVGMKVIQAILEIRKAGLRVAIAWVASDAAPLTVAAQDPGAGASLDKGAKVTISIGLPRFLLASAPPAPAPTPSATTQPAPIPAPSNNPSSAPSTQTTTP